MADVYVRSGASGANNGSSKTDAYTTLAAAAAAKAAGDRFWVASDHAETQASALSITLPGTSASPNYVTCVDFSGSTPPVAADIRTTATIATTGSSTLSVNGTSYFYGINTQRNSSAASQQIVLAGNSGDFQQWERCSHTLNSTGNGARITLGSSNGGQKVVFINTTVGFGTVLQQFQILCKAEWLYTSSAITGTIPTALILFGNTGDLIARGIDFSALGSGKSIVDVNSNISGIFKAIDCKTNAAGSLTSGTIPNASSCKVEFINYGSGSTNYKYYYQDYCGTVSDETTIVVTGGASDGTTSMSKKLVSTANSKIFYPLQCNPILVWNDLTSSITVTAQIITDNITLTDAECWIEVEELGTSGYPLSVLQSDRCATVFTTPANQTSSSTTWTTTGLTTPVTQKLSVTFTPTLKGPLKVRVMLAKPSTTVYVGPKIEIS